MNITSEHFNKLIGEIKENSINLSSKDISYLPMPESLGIFSTEWFPGRLRGQITCITGGTSSAKTSLIKYIIFETIYWAITNNKNYKCIYFALEESQQEFEYSLLSYLVYKLSKGEVRYNIEHFLGVGKAVDKSHFELLDKLESSFKAYMRHIIIEDNTYNTFGIWKITREYARLNGKFFNKSGKELTQEDLDNKQPWSYYVPNDKNAFVEVVVDHLSELEPQQGQADLGIAMSDCVKDMRKFTSKKLNYSCIAIQQQMLEKENIEHIKENEVYASKQGLGDNKKTARAYHNIIGITNINGFGMRIASTSLGSVDISKLGDYQRVISILKKRYGVSNKRVCVYFDGCCGVFKELPNSGSADHKALIEKVQTYSKIK